MRLVRVLLFVVVAAVIGGLFRDQIAMSYRVMRLYTEPPDPSILMPVQGVPRGQVANTWGAPRSGGRSHEGQDIFARRGTPVVAAADGVVTRVGGGKLGGKAVFVTGRGARTFYYAHLDSYAPGIEPGRVVNRGDVLGFVGNTGNARSTPPHLHFGIYGAGGAMNPLPLIESGD
jgi:peptidoglycan LD-endopeptidase LytH